MEAAPLRLVSDPETGEVKCPGCTTRNQQIRDLEDKLAGYVATLDAQARKLGSLERRITEEEDPNHHPKGREITELFDRWRKATGRTTCKLGKPRVKLVKARLADGFKIRLEDGEDPEPTLELAIDGIAAYPYRVFDNRFRDGRPSDRDNDFDRALKDEKHVEELARYGWKARKAGWTVDGWPEEAK